MKAEYGIGDFAKLTGISIKTLRFYDRIGLLTPANVDTRTQYRRYASRQLNDVAAILALKNLGASLSDIKILVGSSASQLRARQLLERLRKRAAASLEATSRSLRWINAALEDEQSSPYQTPIVVRQRPGVRIASVRAVVGAYAEIGEIENELLSAVPVQIAGSQRGVLWHRCADSGAIEGEPFVHVNQRATHAGPFGITDLPCVTVASAYCEPDDGDAARVYEAISRWVHMHDYQLDGPKRELYVGQVLEIQFPIKSA